MKKRRVITAAAGLVCLGGAGVLLYLHFSQEGAGKALQTYMSYIEEQDYDAMYEMLDKESQSLHTREDFVTRNQNIYEGIEAENIEITIAEEQPDSRWISYTTVMNTAAGEISFENSALFHREGLRYKLQWEDYLIFPELTAEDKVRVETLSASRGDILTSDGKALAAQGTVSSVGLVPGKMSEDPRQDLEKLAELLEVSVESIEQSLQASWVTEDSFVPVKKIKKDDSVSMALLGGEMTSSLEQELLEIPGVLITDAEDRIYPMGEAAAHLVGYVQGITAEELEEREGQGYTANSVLGKSGLERVYEDRLKGTDGCRIYIVDKNGNEKAAIALKVKKDGEDIVTTIDSSLQQSLYEQYQEDNSCSVAINPRTGAVLALVSTPSYDSSDFSLGMSQAKWDSLNNDEDLPLTSRFQSSLVPGSSFKPVTAGIGLTTGTLDAQADMGYSGLRWQKDESWGEYYVTTLHEYSGGANLRNALVYSDNIYFAKAALQIGEDTFTGQLDKLGFGQEMPFDLSLATSTWSNSEAMESEIQLADSGYGQGQILVNPIHLASIYSAFVNDGNMILPCLEQQDAVGEFWIEGAFSPEAAAVIREDLVQVIADSSGTGYGAYRDDIVLAGKTGTAEIKMSQEDTNGTELGWFAVFTPEAADEDSLLLVTMVEDVKGRQGSGYVVDHTRQVLDGYLPGTGLGLNRG